MTIIPDFELFQVGGCVRDEMLGIPSSDIDYTAVDTTGCTDVNLSFACLEQRLFEAGFEIFLSTPEFLTLRARFPDSKETADFVLAREDGPYSDGRRPDWVRPGTLLQDLARRDFTINAMARDVEHNLIDPFNGQVDLAKGRLRFVGNSADRLAEDALRAYRLMRFMVTKEMTADSHALAAVAKMSLEDFRSVSTERIVMELRKAYQYDTGMTNWLLSTAMPQFWVLHALAFGEREIWLDPSTKKRPQYAVPVFPEEI